MAVFLGAKVTGTWNEWLMNASPISWMYKFYYLKYLFIILPGTLAGEWMLKDQGNYNPKNQRWFGLLPLLLLLVNLIGLFNRWLVPNLIISALLCGLLIWLSFQSNDNKNSRQHFILAGTYLLMLGLFFEAYEGGIKKDSSTYSYYFVTSGLAFFFLVSLRAISFSSIGSSINQYLSLNGRNPMVAYVAGNLLLTPLLHITQLQPTFNQLNQYGWLGFLKGILFTGVVSLITIYFTRRKWFWKT
jgi:hypothetical protein